MTRLESITTIFGIDSSRQGIIAYETVDAGAVISSGTVPNGRFLTNPDKPVDFLTIIEPSNYFDGIKPVDGKRAPEWSPESLSRRLREAEVVFLVADYQSIPSLPNAFEIAELCAEDPSVVVVKGNPSWGAPCVCWWRLTNALVIDTRLVDEGSIAKAVDESEIKSLFESLPDRAKCLWNRFLSLVASQITDEERYEKACQRLKERLEAKQDAEEKPLDLSCMASEFKTAIETFFDKFHVPQEILALLGCHGFLARHGHEYINFEMGDIEVSPYFGDVLSGRSASKKSTAMKHFIQIPLERLQAHEAARLGTRLTTAALDLEIAKSDYRTVKKKKGATKEEIDAAQSEVEKAQKALWATTPHRYLIHAGSSAGATFVLSENRVCSEARGELDHGAIEIKHDAVRETRSTLGGPFTLDNNMGYTHLVDITDNDGACKGSKSAKDIYGYIPDIGMSYVWGTHPGEKKFSDDNLFTTGTFNRGFFVNIPRTARAPFNDQLKALVPWYDLYLVELPPIKLDFAPKAEEDFHEWNDGEINDLILVAIETRSESSEDYLLRAPEYTIGLAMGFHQINRASTWKKESKDIGGHIPLQVWTLAKEVFRRLYQRREESIETVYSSKKNIPEKADFLPLSAKARKYYAVVKRKQKELGKVWLTYSEIRPGLSNKTSKYADECEKELLNAGLLIIGEREHKGKRRPVIIDATPETN